MSQLLGYAFLSIPLIGAFAMFALGISAIYRASRVLNLAHGAMAMIPAYLFHTMVTTAGLPRVVALPLAVAAGGLLGVGVELLFVRRLRAQGATAQTVGTIAVTGVLVALAAKVWGTASILAPKVFPDGALSVAGSRVSYGDLGLFVVGLITSAAMFAFFRYTEYGLAMRGAAQNRTAARLMGIDPDRAASVAWALGGSLAGLAGILLAAVTTLDPYTLSLQVLPAFVAVLIGGLESLVGAVVGALIVGLAFGLVPALGDVPLIGPLMGNAGAPQLVLTLMALVVMMLRGQRIVGVDEGAGGGFGGGQTFRRLTPERHSRRMLGALVVLAIIPWVVPSSVVGSALLAMQYTLIAISLVLLIGWVGQISLAQATFVGLGAFVSAIFARDIGLGFPAAALFGAAAGMLAAVALGAVALRVRGLYLAVATLIFAWMGDAYLFRAQWLGLSGGSSIIPNQSIGTPGAIPSFDLTSRRVLYFIFLAILIAVVMAVANIRDTKAGRAFFAVRGSEMAAASLGIDVMRTKLIAFAVSGLLAGLAGSMVMMEQRAVVPAQFLFTVSLQFLAIAVVGGLTSLGGAIAAGLLFAGLNEAFFQIAWLSGWLEVVSAGLLAIVLLTYPGGLAAAPDGLRRLDQRLGSPVVRLLRALDRAVHAAVGPLWHALLATGRLIRTSVVGIGARRRDAAEDGIERERQEDFDWMTVAAATAGGDGAYAPTARDPDLADPDGATSADEVTISDVPIDMAEVHTNGHGSNGPAPVFDDRPREERALLIEANGITVRFGGLTAVSDASLAVRENEIVGLIGPNGAGKTTLFNAILGLNDPAEGAVWIHGQDVSGLGPHERARLGVARTFQVVQLFNDLNVRDNLLVATHMHNHTGIVSNLTASRRTLEAEFVCRERVERVVDLLRLHDVADDPVRDLPFGTLRLVELGRALVTGSPVLMLDEAASGLNDAETDRLVQVVRDVRDLGVSVLLIEHDIRMVTGVSDYMYCLDRGAMIAEGTPDEVKRHPDVITAYLGADAEDEATDADSQYADEPTEAEVTG